MNNAVFGKTMENVRKRRYIKLVTTDKKRKRLVLRPGYHTTKSLSENFLAIELKKKAKLNMNKPIYLGFSILEISKALMHELWYEYIKPKYDDNITLCYTDTDSFIFHAKTEDFYEDIDNDVKKWFDTSNYAATLNRPVSIGRTRNKLEK